MGKPSVRQIDVSLGERSYPVTVGAGLLDDLAAHLGPYIRGDRVLVVSDRNVWDALGNRFTLGFTGSGIDVVPIIVPAGEASKDWTTLIGLTDRLIELGMDRSDHLIAFGGGMVGDLAGFAAAIVKRGCSYIHIPTSLLAQVDSSVGGKTAINTEAGKNLIGAFHQPAAVFIDPNTLATLPERELRAGYAEVVKYGLIRDAGFFDWCEENAAALLSGDSGARLHAIETSIRAKAAIVSQDERDVAGPRALLNFGHTFAHALEAEARYSGILHGEAVALGMVLAFRFSAERKLCSAGDGDRVAKHIAGVGLPIGLSAIGAVDPQRLTARMAADKKRRGSSQAFVLTHGIGRAFLDTDVDLADVEEFLGRELS